MRFRRVHSIWLCMQCWFLNHFSFPELIDNVKLIHKPVSLQPRGLINKGNWCYINAVSFYIHNCALWLTVNLIFSLYSYLYRSCECVLIIAGNFPFCLLNTIFTWRGWAEWNNCPVTTIYRFSLVCGAIWDERLNGFHCCVMSRLGVHWVTT